MASNENDFDFENMRFQDRFQDTLKKMLQNVNTDQSKNYLKLPSSRNNEIDCILNNHIQWLYIRKTNWKSTELPSQTYVFMRNNANNGVYGHTIYFYEELNVIYSSNTYHIVAIPAIDLDDPVVIILLNKVHSMMLALPLSVEIIDACITRTNWNEILMNYMGETFIPLTISKESQNNNDDIKPILFKELFGEMLINVVTTTDALNFQKTFIIDEVTNKPIQVFENTSNRNERISLLDLAKSVLSLIENFAFIKYKVRKMAGLVVSLHRLKYYKKNVKLVSNPDYSLLDDLRMVIDQFIIFNSPNLPGIFFNSEKTILLEANHNITDNAKIF